MLFRSPVTMNVGFGKEFGYIVVSEEIASAFGGRYVASNTVGFAKSLFENSHYIIRTNGSASYQQFIDAMAYYAGMMTEYDELYIYMLAHGIEPQELPEGSGDEGYELNGKRYGYTDGLFLDKVMYYGGNDNQLPGILNTVPGRKVLITDTCYSGRIIDLLAMAPEDYPNITVVTAANAIEPALAHWVGEENETWVIGPLLNMINMNTNIRDGYPTFLHELYLACQDEANYVDGRLTAPQMLGLLGKLGRWVLEFPWPGKDEAHPQQFTTSGSNVVLSID